MSVILSSITISFNNKAFDVISVNYSQFYNFYALLPRNAGSSQPDGCHNMAVKTAFQRDF